MNQKTLVTLGIVAAVGVVAYFGYRYYIANRVVQPQPSNNPNAGGGSSLGDVVDTIQGAWDALGNLFNRGN